jgi:hypothetical protein
MPSTRLIHSARPYAKRRRRRERWRRDGHATGQRSSWSARALGVGDVTVGAREIERRGQDEAAVFESGKGDHEHEVLRTIGRGARGDAREGMFEKAIVDVRRDRRFVGESRRDGSGTTCGCRSLRRAIG